MAHLFRPWATGLAAAAMLVVLASGVAKLLDVPGFGAVLDTYKLIPKSVIGLASILIPSLEVAVSLAWLIWGQRGWLAVSCAALLFVFSLVLSVHYVLGEYPSCGCFGRWFSESAATKDLRWVLTRNALLIAPLIASFFAQRQSKPAAGAG